MNAAMQDGGGSSTLWVDGQVRNTPSGKGADEKAGSLRVVANGYLIAQVLPPMKSAAFKAGQKVRLNSRGELRLGPGATFGIAGKVADTDGNHPAESLNGILPRAHWWAYRFGETEGWASLEQLTTIPTRLYDEPIPHIHYPPEPVMNLLSTLLPPPPLSVPLYFIASAALAINPSATSPAPGSCFWTIIWCPRKQYHPHLSSL
jgi:hypothetical protein